MLMMNDMMRLRVVIHTMIQSCFQLQSLIKKYKPTAFVMKSDTNNEIYIGCNKK